jgi:RNA polymerase sigma-70 factor (ECF subfamily)
LRAAIAALPPVQRDAFLLQHEGGLSLGEIADLNGVGVETIKSRLRYATGRLRASLRELRADAAE